MVTKNCSKELTYEDYCYECKSYSCGCQKHHDHHNEYNCHDECKPVDFKNTFTIIYNKLMSAFDIYKNENEKQIIS